jgi:transposase
MVNIIGLDLAKRTFQLHGSHSNGGVAFRKKVSRDKVLTFPSMRRFPRDASL